MRPGNTASVKQLEVINQFENFRKILLSEPYTEHLDRSLAYWALPADRCLPLAFLSRTLRELLNTPFAELAQTPGIGRKKLGSLIKLLARVANTGSAEPPVAVDDIQSEAETSSVADLDMESDQFDPALVSELQWRQWQTSVLRHGLNQEKLGRFAPSLQNMTRIIWNTSLEEYARYTLAEIRNLKTHGEKRINALLEVFHCLHSVVARMGSPKHLAVRIVPRLIDQVEQWVGYALQKPGVSSEAELFQNFISPLLEQIRIDAPQQIVTLAENRLGLRGPITSIRKVARNMGLTRARVYQLLNEINDIMTIRWPLGRHQVYELRNKFAAEIVDLESPPSLVQFHAALELFYPSSRRGADGPLETAADISEDQSDMTRI